MLHRTSWLIAPLVMLALLLSLAPADEKADTPNITWKKTVLDRAFRSEGVTVADVNRDGKMDVVNGEVWYEAPDWKMHEFRPTKDYTKGQDNVYSQSFCCWAEDVNGDGWSGDRAFVFDPARADEMYLVAIPAHHARFDRHVVG